MLFGSVFIAGCLVTTGEAGDFFDSPMWPFVWIAFPVIAMVVQRRMGGNPALKGLAAVAPAAAVLVASVVTEGGEDGLWLAGLLFLLFLSVWTGAAAAGAKLLYARRS